MSQSVDGLTHIMRESHISHGVHISHILSPVCCRKLLALATLVVLTACASERTAELSNPNGLNDQPAALENSLGAVFDGIALSNEPPEPTAEVGPELRAGFGEDSVILLVEPAVGDSINAMQPPVLELNDGSRHVFSGRAITSDSTYFTGDVRLVLSRSLLPLKGTLYTSYCRSGERLCRSVTRTVHVEDKGSNY